MWQDPKKPFYAEILMARQNPHQPKKPFKAKRVRLRYLLPAASLGVMVAVTIGYFSSQRYSGPLPNEPIPAAPEKKTATFALEQRKREPKVDQKSERLPDEALDPMLVQSLLEDIVLDENQVVVVNDQTRRQLDEAVFKLGFEANRADLDLLEQLIKGGLPELAGAQAADIFRRYYEYKSAEMDLLASASGSSTEINQHLDALRQSYLGHELSERLFGEQQRYTRYAQEMMAIEEDSSISAREREAQQLRLQREYYGEQEPPDLLD